MNKIIKTITIVGIFCGSFLHTQQKSWQSLDQLILRVHVVAFSKDNVFDKQMTAGETKQWNAMLDEVREEIKRLAHGDKKIIEAMTFAVNLGDEIMNTQKMIFATVFSKGTKPSAQAMNTARQKLDELANKAKKLDELSQKMIKSTYWFNKGDKQEARRTLSEVLFLVLESSILKINNDFRKHPLTMTLATEPSA